MSKLKQVIARLKAQGGINRRDEQALLELALELALDQLTAKKQRSICAAVLLEQRRKWHEFERFNREQREIRKQLERAA